MRNLPAKKKRDELKKIAFEVMDTVYHWTRKHAFGDGVHITGAFSSVSDSEWSIGFYGTLDGRSVYLSVHGALGDIELTRLKEKIVKGQWQLLLDDPNVLLNKLDNMTK